MNLRAIRLTIAAGALAAAAAPFATSTAQAVVCPPPVWSTVCWAWGTACQYVPHEAGKFDPNALLCTVAA